MKQLPEQFKLRFTDIQQSTEREFVGGRHFLFDVKAVADALSLPLTPRMVDLLRIASCVYFIDRLVKRNRRHGSDGWSRKIACSIEVREFDFWEQATVRDIVEQAVQFVSGDKWFFSYVRDRAAGRLPNGGLFDAKELFATLPIINLYSGGLDSAAGVARQLSIGIARPLIPVIVGHRTDVISTATSQLSQISNHFGIKLAPVSVAFSMTPPADLVGAEELSQRTRAFLFVATGGVVAGVTGASNVELYESGIGAVNAPLLAGMAGSQATRIAHPKFLELMSRLLSLVADHRIDVTLPFVTLSKGDVAKSLSDERLRDIAKSTVSCAHFPIRLEKGGTWKSCGVCPACIFRRVALNAAGIEEGPGVYQHDLLDPLSCRLSAKKLRYLLAYLVQVDSLTELDQCRIPSLISGHLRQTGIVRPGEPQGPYLSFLRRYRTDWRGFLERARKNGCDWASRIDLPRQAA